MYYKTAILITLTALMGCSTVYYGDVYESSEGDTGNFILNQLADTDQLAGGHVTGEKPVQEIKMAPADRQFLEEQCAACHSLNRTFATKGKRELWEKLLDQPQHKQAGFSQEDQEKLLTIFQKYLAQ